MNPDLLSQALEKSTQFSELCSALYEREIKSLANVSIISTAQMQGRLKSLPHYVKQTAASMLAAESPLSLDLQNASWSQKQARNIPIKEQDVADIRKWYQAKPLVLGLVVPVLVEYKDKSRIMIDCIDRIDEQQHRVRSNFCGWFNLEQDVMHKDHQFKLLKPSKKVLAAACSGHQWQGNSRTQPLTLSLRELLLSCQINWPNLRNTCHLKINTF